MSNVLIATGGSGGHIFPAIKVAKILSANGHKPIFIGENNLFVDKIKREGFGFKEIKSKGFDSSNIKALFLSIIRLMQSFFSSFNSVLKVNPDIVIGFGGYSSFPVVICSVLLFKPTIIHEQNVMPGRANKILSLFVKKIAISFKESKKFFNNKKTVFTGCPINIEKKEFSRGYILDKFNFMPDKKTILIFGGSQGSHTINSVTVKAIELLKENISMQIIHISGYKDKSMLYDYYQRLDIPFILSDFIDDMGDVYNIADVVISRAGAVTITEIAMFDKPAVLIPYPYARGHQIYNAMLLQNSGKAFILKEDEICPSFIKDKILCALNSKSKYIDVYVKDSAERIQSIIESVLK